MRAVDYAEPEILDSELGPQQQHSSFAADRIGAGRQAVGVFARQLTTRVLRVHAELSPCPSELEREVPWAPQTSLRTATLTLSRLGALARIEPAGGGRATATELTAAGRDLLLVAEALERWLLWGPDGPIPLDSIVGRGTVKALAAGWESAIAIALTERPLSIAELSETIPHVNYPSLKRRLAKLRSTGLISPLGRSRATRYFATEWLRSADEPISVAGDWERRYVPDLEPVS